MNIAFFYICIPASVKYIEGSAFQDAPIKKLEFAPNSQLEIIGEEAFQDTNIREIKFPGDSELKIIEKRSVL